MAEKNFWKAVELAIATALIPLQCVYAVVNIATSYADQVVEILNK